MEEELDAAARVDTAVDEEAVVARASPLVTDVSQLGGARPSYYAQLWCIKEHPRRDSEQVN